VSATLRIDPIKFEKPRALRSVGDESLSDKTDRRAALRIRQYCILFCGLVGLSFFVSNWEWSGGGLALHNLLETMSALSGLAVGVFAITMSLLDRRLKTILLGSVFAVTALLDGYHAGVAGGYVAALSSEVMPEALAIWSGTASRFFLSLGMLVVVCARSSASRSTPQKVSWYVLVFIVLTGLCGLSALLAWTRFSGAMASGLLLTWLRELLPGLLFFCAFVILMAQGAWKKATIDYGIGCFLIVGTMMQIAFMSLSRAPYDAMFNAAHALKLISYWCVFLGLGAECCNALAGRVMADRRVRKLNKGMQREQRNNQDMREELNSIKRALELDSVERKEELNKQRLAALNIMEDALEAQKETKAAALALMNSEENLKNIISELTDAIVVTSLDKKVLFLNPAAEQMLGYTAQDLIGQPFEYAFAIDQTEPLRIEKPGGSYALADVKCVETKWGQAQAHLISLRDVTLKKQMLDQLNQSQKMEAVGQMAGGIAHDFNNLLTIICGWNRYIMNSVDKDSMQYKASEEIRLGAERAVKLTKHLLTISRRQVVQTQVVNLNDIIIELDSFLRRLIGPGIEMVVAPGVSLKNVSIDPGHAEQILTNLVVNACDAMPKGGKIVIETRNVSLTDDLRQKFPEVKGDSLVMMCVRDTGYGIPQDVLPHIFEPFYTTKSKDKGSGLGLSTTYGIVQQNEGYIWVTSDVGQGAVFEIYFPGTENALDISENRPGTACAMSRGEESILVVDDEVALRALVVNTLSGQGYRVHEAGNGEEALTTLGRLNGNLPKLVVTDILMPQMDGRELAKRVANNYPDMKIIFVSGYTERVIDPKDFKGVTWAYLAKPFAMETLAVKVREMLDL